MSARDGGSRGCALRMLAFTILSGAGLSACGDITAPDLNRPASVQIVPVGTIESIDEELSLEARVFDIAGSKMQGISLDWEVSNPEILEEVSPGIFRSKANGSTTVRARVRSGATGGSSAAGDLAGTGPSAEMVVRIRQVPARIELGETQLNLWSINQVVPLAAVVVDAMGTPVADAPPIAWSTRGSGVVTVEGNGRLRAIGEGSTTVMATAGGVIEFAPVAVYATVPFETCFSFSVAGAASPMAKCATVNISLREVE